MSGWSKAATAAGPSWKPKACADCGAPEPSRNRDGGRAGTPWRCPPCDATAEPLPPADPFATETGQGSLL